MLNLIETTLLLANSAILVEPRKELSTLPEKATWTQLEQLPYLSAVVEEGNRLAFGVTAHTAWISYKSPTYSPSQFAINSSKFNESYTIPGGTPVSAPTLNIHTAENIFPNPFTSDPERWLGEDGRTLCKFRMAFGKDGRKCLGIELALAEILLATGYVDHNIHDRSLHVL